ncbi:MAG: DUF1549 domain-containing protein, partial [Planctomycetales bacterium]|nr:DUF1549 domain-containing protein [Planctomycetales bacterium]
ISSGGREDSAAVRDANQVVELEVYPGVAYIPSGQSSFSECSTQNLVVQATFADGSVRDVTRWARMEPSVVTGIEITDLGSVQVNRPMDVTISVSYLNGRAASRLVFLPQAQSTWEQAPPTTELDRLVELQLRQLQLTPTELASESTFFRRLFLTVVGRLPKADEVRTFMDDRSPDKRQRWVESLLGDPGYAQMWALRWSDLLRNEQKVMSTEGAKRLFDWLSERMARDYPLNQMVYELVATPGSTYEHPAASFHRTHRDPETAAESIGQVFLGVRLQCARCHNHPFDKWRQDDYYGLAAYFTTIERKQLDNQPNDKYDKHIITGDELISFEDRKPKIWHPGRAYEIAPKSLSETFVAMADGQNSEATERPLEKLASWLRDGNRQLARNLANRIWSQYMGRGIVDPPDDFRDSNPPSNPALLEYLTDELIQSNYSAQHVARLILKSRAFSRSAAHELDASSELDRSTFFASYPLHRMPAEVLLDALVDATDSQDVSASTELQAGQRAISAADTPTKAGFLTAFGKPNRLLVCECERSGDVSLGQSLLLINGEEVRNCLSARGNRVVNLIERGLSSHAIVEELYLGAISRFPSTLESDQLATYIDEADDRPAAVEDVLWALINSKEFAIVQ